MLLQKIYSENTVPVMATLLLLVIYLAFISLGLPDSLLGVSWPLAHIEFGALQETAGIITIIITGGTILSSLFSPRLVKKIGTPKVIILSVFLTCISLFGISSSRSLNWLIVLALPLGAGGGAIDAALNAYIAHNYKSYHMSWLHSFWGVGAMTGPAIMSYFIADSGEWRKGYFTVAVIQCILLVILIMALPLWKKVTPKDTAAEIKKTESTLSDALPSMIKLKGISLALISFFLYCGIESTMGIWGSSFLVNIKGFTASKAAQFVSLFYAGIMFGRFLTGFATMMASNRFLIRCGQIILLTGSLLLVVPGSALFSMIGFILIGLGCAPIFPCMLHDTPVRFGKENTTSIMGLQMATAYTGATFLPPLLGLAASHITFYLFAYAVFAYALVMLFCSEMLNAKLKKTGSV